MRTKRGSTTPKQSKERLKLSLPGSLRLPRIFNLVENVVLLTSGMVEAPFKARRKTNKKKRCWGHPTVKLPIGVPNRCCGRYLSQTPELPRQLFRITSQTSKMVKMCLAYNYCNLNWITAALGVTWSAMLAQNCWRAASCQSGHCCWTGSWLWSDNLVEQIVSATDFT